MSYEWSRQHTQFCDYHVIQMEILRALRSTTFATSSWAPYFIHLTCRRQRLITLVLKIICSCPWLQRITWKSNSKYFTRPWLLFGDQIVILKGIMTYVRLLVLLTAMSKHCDLIRFKLVKVIGKDFLQKKHKCKNYPIRDVEFGHYPQFEKHLPPTL